MIDVALISLLLISSSASLLIFPAIGFYIQIVLNFVLFFIALFLAERRGYRIRKKLFRMGTFGSVTQFSIYIGVFYIVLMVSAGFVMGFGESPYSHTPLGILLNAFYVSAFVLGFEFSRTYLLRRLKKTWAIPAIAVFYTIAVLIPTFRFLPQGKLETLKYIGSDIIPTLTQQLFATILAYYSGAYASSIYVGIAMGFEWFSPILPKLDWMLNSFIKSLAPAIGYAILSSEASIKQIKVKKGEDLKSWIATFVACMLLLLFFTGKLGYHPAVVGSGSMSPTICTGDIVIVKKVNLSEIHVGDIVQYYSDEGYTITHRVIKIEETPNGLIFVTKGDANDIPDKPFKADRILGKVVFVIPKLGLIPLMIRDLLRMIVGGG